MCVHVQTLCTAISTVVSNPRSFFPSLRRFAFAILTSKQLKASAYQTHTPHILLR